MNSIRAFARSAPRTVSRLSASATRRPLSSLQISSPLRSPLKPSFRLLTPTFYAAFSTSRTRWEKAGEVDDELAAKAESELQREKEWKDPDELPPSLKDYLESSPFKITDVPGQEEVELTRQFGNESIKVIFTIADLKESDSDTDADRYDYPIYDEGDSDDEGSGDEDSRPQVKGVTKARGSPVDVAPKGKAAPADHPELAGEEEADSLRRGPPNFLARANVIIDKAGQGTLRIETVVEDGVVAIDNVHYLPSAELADVKNAEKDWQRIAMYKGPPFGILDEDLQVLFERYIDERGVNTALALFIPDYIDFKEQREYVSWLSNLKNFVEA